MEYSRPKRKERNAPSILTDAYPHDVSLYRTPPDGIIDLEQFEELAIDRLKALRIIESINLRGLKAEDAKAAAIAELTKQDLRYFAKLIQTCGFGKTENEVAARKKDHISHFILQLAYCRTEELRRWFSKQENDLFRMRFNNLSAEGIKVFLKVNKLNYEPIAESVKNKMRDVLYHSTPMLSRAQIDSTDFYCIPFANVLPLVKARKCYLHRGNAYIPSTELGSLISGIFRANLNEYLAKTAMKLLPFMSQDERVCGLVKNLHTSYIQKDTYNTIKAQVPIESIDALSRKSFPLCMRQAHENLRANHHLRHGGRLMYGLFLKGIGVTLEDALTFWRQEFTQKMDNDKFEKQYAYNVRYNYGKEGKQVNYSPQSCMKIIMGSVAAGDSHGCPFRHNDVNTLTRQLGACDISTNGVKEVLEFVKGGHFQLACGRYFELAHNVLPNSVAINHPNQYFEESKKLQLGAQTPGVANNSAKKTKMEPPATAMNSTSKANATEEDPWNYTIDLKDLPDGV